MKSTTETGHAKNVANFEDLISFCTAYGTNYNPSKTSISLASLNTIYTNALATIANVTTTKNAFDNVTGIRQTAFAPLKPLATKVINSLSATDALDTVVKDAKTINRKLQGSRAMSSSNSTAIPTASEGSTTTISTSQQSYDRLIDSFGKLIDLVNAETNYIPNETELQVTSLNTKLASLQTTNTAVISKYTDYSNARIQRNSLLYTNTSSLVETALDVKKYIKSVFGASSPQYKQVSSLKFSKPKL
ncbi:hypothetical protein [Flavobacterium sp.]|uniref:hypothetical protein n=1 Tax=Flavobacterium sp. TaxID=239 RepID=UPI00262A8D80|nr:hypothetical protein [Flavobacterium sp.]